MSNLSQRPSASAAGTLDTDEESPPGDGAEKPNQRSFCGRDEITPTPTSAHRGYPGDSFRTVRPDAPPVVAFSMSEAHKANGATKRRFRPGAPTSDAPPGSPVSSSSTLPPMGSDGVSSPPPSQPPSRAPSVKSRGEPASRRSSFSRPDARPGSIAGTAASSEAGGHRFTLKDLLANGPKAGRKPSVSSRRSDVSSEHGGAPESASSLLQKYGVCERVAIGKGATSVVRLAHKWDRAEEKLYAVKEFRARRKNETEREYIKKLTAEFCISSTLHHINIVETVDLVQDESKRWCEVMEYCPGGDLYAAIKKGGMSPSEVECCFKQILTGIAYLHAQGVAHRDIKPENLFFDTRGHLKIGDYGASTVYRLPWEATVHMSTGLCGSEPYIAPEQFLGKPYDARLVDELPWRAAQTSDPHYFAYQSFCISHPWKGPPAAPPAALPTTITNVSPRVARTLLRRILEPDPRLRCTIQEVMEHPWLQSIEVCTEVKYPKHQHINVRAILHQPVVVRP
ncbi:hypothetical protein BS47DRAFT_1336614 [Hydnum rufescens UP504]|uniref:non-specific serine/threonine protein kinase n=1 Tax=Hydnum rufescens UP504 TaxID=1448309 RepID=A0A9P6B8X1_9AGAM|nr:hypothetical protein BS47DRAFT_1336614 [Hydnum rufescens UP504]